MTAHICPFARQSSTPATHGVMTDIKGIILHDTEGWRTYDRQIFTTGKRGDTTVSIQFYVMEDGVIEQYMPSNVAAWHAGRSMLPDGTTDVSNHTVGIELEHGPVASRVYPEVQLAALDRLIAWLDGDIGPKPIYAHYQIAPDRKSDPNGPFPMSNYQKFRNHTGTTTTKEEAVKLLTVTCPSRAVADEVNESAKASGAIDWRFGSRPVISKSTWRNEADFEGIKKKWEGRGCVCEVTVTGAGGKLVK